MPHLPKRLAPVRAAVALILTPCSNRNRLYPAEDIANAINIAADVKGNAASSHGVDTTLILRAFANEGADEYTLPYGSVLGRDADDQILHVRRESKHGRKAGKDFSIAIGRFDSIDEAKFAKVIRWNYGMDEGDRLRLVQCVAEATKPAAKKRKAPAISPVDEEDASGAPLSRQPLVSVNPPPAPAVMTSMHYTLGGRAGKVVVPKGTSFVTFKKLRDNLFPPPIDCGNSDENAGRSLVLQTYGPDQHWIRSGVTAIATNHLSRLQKQAEVSTNWSALFDGERCTFSDRFHRTLSTFGLHNMRGSDEGMEMIIAGVVKGLAHEVGLPISEQALACGCPSRKTLARNEKRLAADCYAAVVQDIKKDGTKWISLMVDHGKRSGIEHFVKIILWAGQDENGNKVIKNFCLDVDKSNHSANDCAEAISMSIKRLRAAGLDTNTVEFFAITGDSGGGGAVQHIHPPLVANKTMTKNSKRINCQLHGVAKSLQNSCEATKRLRRR